MVAPSRLSEAPQGDWLRPITERKEGQPEAGGRRRSFTTHEREQMKPDQKKGCPALTHKGTRCPNRPDETRDGWCHVHDPEGIWRQQRPGYKPKLWREVGLSGAEKCILCAEPVIPGDVVVIAETGFFHHFHTVEDEAE